MINVGSTLKTVIRIASWATPHIKQWQHDRAYHASEASRHLEAGNWPEAEQHLTAALAENHHSQQKRLDLVVGLKDAQLRQGKLQDAEISARAAVELAGKDTAARAKALEALVDVQLDRAAYGEAEASISEIEQLERSRSKPDHARLARCAFKLATAFRKNGGLQAAAEALEKASRLYRQVFGMNHVETAAAYAQLGVVYLELGEHEAAQQHLRHALGAYTEVLGSDCKEVTYCLSYLASSLEQSGHVTDAVTEYEKALFLKERQLGGSPVEKAELQARLAALYVRARRTGAARELLIQAIAILGRTNHPAYLAALEAMAQVEDQMGRPEEASSYREKARTLTASA